MFILAVSTILIFTEEASFSVSQRPTHWLLAHWSINAHCSPSMHTNTPICSNRITCPIILLIFVENLFDLVDSSHCFATKRRKSACSWREHNTICAVEASEAKQWHKTAPSLSDNTRPRCTSGTRDRTIIYDISDVCVLRFGYGIKTVMARWHRVPKMKRRNVNKWHQIQLMKDVTIKRNKYELLNNMV